MNQTVYHYSSIEVLKIILNNKKLRFTKINSLNDKSEYQYGTEILKQKIIEFEKNNKITNQLDIKLLDKFFFYSNLYSLSFTENGNDLAFWNSYYVNKITPVSIGFEREKVFSENFIINKCIYDDPYPIMEKKRYDWFKNIFDLKNIPILHKNREFIQFTFQTAHIKQNFFKVENEYRAVSFLPNDNNSYGTFKRNSKSIEYFDQDINIESINEIIIGPSKQQDLNYKEISSIVSNQNLKCSVKKSEIPLEL